MKSRNVFERNPKTTLSIAVLIFLTLLIGGSELALRMFTTLPSGQSISQYTTNRYIQLREYKPGASMVLVPSETRLMISDGLQKAEYPLNIDENGFVEPSIIYEHPDVVLVFLGGSTTECAYVQEEKRFPFLVGRKLEGFTQKRINSINAGMRANTTLNTLDGFLNKVLPLNPQIAVLMHNINDIAMLLYEKTYWNMNQSNRSPIVIVEPHQEKIPTLRTLLADSLQVFIPYTTQQFLRIRDRMSGKEEGVDEFASVNAENLIIDEAYKNYMSTEFRKNLQTFIGICRARTITPVLMTQASRFKDDPDAVILGHFEQLIDKRKLNLDYYGLKELHERFNQTIREVGRDNNVLVIDLARQIPQKKDFIADAVHYNDVGSELAAEIISREICTNIFQKDRL